MFTFWTFLRHRQTRRRERKDANSAYWRRAIYDLRAHHRSCERVLLDPIMDEMHIFTQFSEHVWLDRNWPHSYTSHRYSLLRLKPLSTEPIVIM
jgi:hypothetical protein